MLLSLYFIANGVIHGILAAGSFFFAYNSEVLYLCFLLSNVFLASAAALGIYLVVYILFPEVSPWPKVIAVIILGVVLVGATIVAHPLPLGRDDGVDWNLSGWPAALLAGLIFTNIGASLIIFASAFIRVRSLEVKIISFAIVLSTIFGILDNIIRFLPQSIVLPNAFTRIVFDAATGMVLVVAFLPPPAFIRRIASHIGSI